MISREIISNNFRYLTNDFNSRYGFPEEEVTNFNGFEKRVDYWKYLFYKNFKLEKHDRVCFSISHVGIDTMSMIFAAAELALTIVPTNDVDKPIDLFIHNLPDTNNSFKKISALSKQTYHHFDVADLLLKDKNSLEAISRKRANDDNVLFPNMTHCQATDYISKLNNISGNIIHIKNCYDTSNILSLIHTLSLDSIDQHIGIGYNVLFEGMIKIVELVKRFKITNIDFSTNEEVELFLKTAAVKELDVKDVNLLLNDTEVDRDIKHDTVTIKNTIIDKSIIENIPIKFKVDGRLIADPMYNYFYFAFNNTVVDAVANIKINILNNEIKKYVNSEIVLHRVVKNRLLDEIELLHYFRDQSSLD
jgi:hypothetical protein